MYTSRSQEPIPLIQQWVKKYSIFIVLYRHWRISIVDDERLSVAPNFTITCFAGTHDKTRAVKDYFLSKGMKSDPDSATGRYILIYKTGAL